LAGSAGQSAESLKAGVKPTDNFVQHALGNGGVAPVAIEHVFLFIQVFEHVRFEVGPGANVHHLKNGGEGVVVVNGVFARDQLEEADEEMF
jgi:hypothetical protein